MRYILFSFISLPLAAFAQTEPLENFRFELTASTWRPSIGGTVMAFGRPIALRGDLKLDDSWLFFGKLVVKPGRRHRIVVEGSPYSFTGLNNLARTITFNGRTYSVQQTVASKADLNYFFAGYQFDLLSRDRGHLGLEAGGAYLDATGTISGITTAATATRNERFGLPLAGAEFRWFLIPGSRLLNINGEAKGMSFAGYGNFFQGAFHVGVGTRRFAVQAGYQYLSADLHTNHGVNPPGIAPVFRGPIFSVQLRDR
jgi:hypothetical protein